MADVEAKEQVPGLMVDLNEAGLLGWRSFLEAHFRIMRTLEAELAAERGLGLGLAEYVVMFHLSMAANQEIRMNDLADMAFLSRSGMTRVVDRLERGDLVVRKPFPSDQRRKLAVLTPAGLHRLRRAFPVHHHGLQRNVTSRLTDQEWATLRALMDRLG